MTGDPVDCPCGKRGYGGRRAARKANERNGHRLRAYRCEYGYWHVTKAHQAGWWRDSHVRALRRTGAAQGRQGREA